MIISLLSFKVCGGYNTSLQPELYLTGGGRLCSICPITVIMLNRLLRVYRDCRVLACFIGDYSVFLPSCHVVSDWFGLVGLLWLVLVSYL